MTRCGKDSERSRSLSEIKLALARDVETEHYLGDRKTGRILSHDHLRAIAMQEPLADFPRKEQIPFRGNFE